MLWFLRPAVDWEIGEINQDAPLTADIIFKNDSELDMTDVVSVCEMNDIRYVGGSFEGSLYMHTLRPRPTRVAAHDKLTLDCDFGRLVVGQLARADLTLAVEYSYLLGLWKRESVRRVIVEKDSAG